MDSVTHTFQIETHVPGFGLWDTAYADSPEDAFEATDRLLKEAGINHTRATVTNLVSGEVVWRGDTVATRAFRGFGR